MVERRIMPEVLTDFVARIFSKTGMPASDAEYSAECMVQTNLWGVDSHGLLRLPIYESRLSKKIVNPRPEMRVVKGEDSAIGVLDGDAGLGYVVGREGMKLAVKKAKRFGIGFVLTINSNHFGAASLFTLIAAQAGLISIAATNVIPNIGMRGGVRPATGNNPVAFMVPISGHPPFSLDISMSSVAGGKLLLAAKKGEKIPLDWAVTKSGEDTDDPKSGFDGILLPMGMHKGFGMFLFIDIITGVLGGGPFLGRLKSMYKHPDAPSETTHVFAAVDPECFLDSSLFAARMREWLDMVHSVPVRDEAEPLKIPGEIEAATERERRMTGIPIPDALRIELVEIAARHGISATFL